MQFSETKKSAFNFDIETSSDECTSSSEKEKLQFDITFSATKWEVIQPREKTYIEKRGPKTYNILAPYEWCNVVQDHFYLHTKLPGCLKFKKANVRKCGVIYLSLNGRCLDCGSIFNETIDSIPASNSRLVSL